MLSLYNCSGLMFMLIVIVCCCSVCMRLMSVDFFFKGGIL